VFVSIYVKFSHCVKPALLYFSSLKPVLISVLCLVAKGGFLCSAVQLLSCVAACSLVCACVITVFVYLYYVACYQKETVTRLVYYTTTPQPFYSHFSENFWTLRCKGRLTDHPAGRHSIQPNQCPPPPSPHFFTGDALPVGQPLNIVF